MNNGIESLRGLLDAKVVDPFNDLDVIRWVSGGRYTYAAIRTPIGWVNTSGSSRLNRVTTYEELVNHLARADVSDIEVATRWDAV